MSGPYRRIDRGIGERVRRLHKKHPQLGHDGIRRLLESEGVSVDPAELRVYLKAIGLRGNSVGARPAHTPAAAGWAFGLLHPGSPVGDGGIPFGDGDSGFGSDGGDGSD